MNDNDFRKYIDEYLLEPYLSIFLWCIDFLIEISEWYHEKLNADNNMIDAFVPNLFGFDIGQKHQLTQNAYSFVIRVINLRKKQQFKLH